MEKIKTIEDVEIEIRRAVLILKTLPREGPKRYRASWPVFVMDEMDDHSEAVISRFYRPLASELDDMEEVLENWFKVLSYDERVLVFKRTSGQTWKVLSRSYKMTRSWLTVKYRRCLKKIFDYVMERQNIQDREAV